MGTRTKFGLALTWLILVAILVMTAGPISADPNLQRPSAPVAPVPMDADTFTVADANAGESTVHLQSTQGDRASALQDGGDRLVDLQNNDGGWDWPLDNGDPTTSSPANTIGPIAMGLAEAYWHTGDADHLAALQGAGTFLLAKTNNFSPPDGYLAARLDQVFGGTTYSDHVKANFYDPLDAGTYNRNGAGILYNTAGYVQKIRDDRATQGIANLAAWDIGMGLVGAASVAGASTTEWVTGVKAEIDELDGDEYYDVIGLAGAIYGLAFVGEDYDPTAGEHAAASSLSDLATILASYQINGGGFTWNSNYVIPNDNNETIQETSYAILALNEVDRVSYLSAIQGAADYMTDVQLSTGGWENYVGSTSGENNEVTGEALWGISVAYPEVWVDATTGNDSNDGSKASPFATIQKGLDEVPVGGIVNVAAGTYAESVTIDKYNLTLLGDSSLRPAITGGLKFDTNLTGLTFKNFVVSGNAVAGQNSVVRMYGAITDLTIDNCVFDGEDVAGRMGFTGGQLEGDVTVTNSEFKNILGWAVLDSRSGSGGDGSAMGTVTFANNNVHDCDGSVVFRGLSTDWTDNVYIYGNTFEDIGKAGVSDHWAAFEVNRANNVEIHNNEIRYVVESSGGEGQAIQLWKVGTVDIYDNTIENNYMGIAILKWPAAETYDVSGIAIYGNSFSGNDQFALSVENGLDGGPVNAEKNWWGDKTGPSGEGAGSGDAVSTYVDYSPWLGNYPSTPGSNTYYVDDTSSTAEIQALIDGASSGDTIVLAAGAYAPSGGFTIGSAGITIMLSDGTIIQASSPCFTVNADNTTITSATTGPGFTGGICEPSGGSNGIETSKDVNNLVIRDVEIRNGTGTGDGIHIGHNVTNLQILNNYIHHMGGDGIEYAAGVTVGSVHEVQGNLFQSNGGNGINNVDGPSYDVKYNSWNHYDGPTGGDPANGLLDYDPWTHVALSMASSGSPVANKVGEGYQITYKVQMDAKEVYGADFDLKFDETKLEVKSITNSGNFDQNDQCKISTPAEANTSGEISFCGSRTTALNGLAQDVFEVVFEGLDSGVVTLDLDETDDAFGMSPPGGASNNIYASALTNGSVTVYDTETVTGRIDLQGRADDTGAVMTFDPTGVNQGYGPFTFTTSTYWGSISASNVVEDTYLIIVSMDRYLDVTSASGRSVDISASKTALATLVLVGGDAYDDDQIDMSDISIVAGEYGHSGGGIGDDRADINADNTIDMSDLVLVCGNYYKSSDAGAGYPYTFAYGSWTP